MKRIIEAVITFDVILFSIFLIIVGAFFLYNNYIDPPETGGAPAEYIDYYADFGGDLVKEPGLTIHLYGKKWQATYEEQGDFDLKEKTNE